MAYLRDVHEFRDTAGEHPTPVEVMGEDGEPVTPL
jgi:hypothetical protein